ncbi:hypothetical protein J7K50_09070 [bacterium]|nr:hypothetical protein [bacterium]
MIPGLNGLNRGGAELIRFQTILVLSILILFLALSSCARDALKGAPQAAENIKITAKFDSLVNEVYYFFVFNFTDAAAPSESLRPEPNVSGPDRGSNWEMYIVYHHTGGQTGAMWEVLSREPGDGDFWVDEIPEPLIQQFFYLSASASGNSITIELDPLELVDPNNNVPTSFILDIITANSGIDKQTNPEDLGEVFDWLDDIVVANIIVGEEVSETELLIEQFDDATNLITGSDLTYWRIEVK